MQPWRPSVILVAHGSSISEGAQEAAMQHVITLRASNRYGHIGVCFLARDKTEPVLPSGEIYILPFFMSDGYFVTKRIPELFRLENGTRIEPERQLFLCEALGIDPELAEIISVMAKNICKEKSLRPAAIHLVLVAHGSEKSGASAKATYTQQEAVENRGEFAKVSSVFLNEAPFLDDWLLTQVKGGPPIVLVGLFAAEGPHATEDVPGAIVNWQSKSQDRFPAYYAGAIGAQPEIVRLIQHSISRRAIKTD